VFFKHNETGQTMLIVVCFVNNMLLVGTKEQAELFMKGIKKRFGYSNLGKLQKHLGIWYEEKFDENGEIYLETMMPKMELDIIKLYEKHTGEPVKESSMAGTPGECTCKWKGNPFEHTMYHKIVGKIMYLACKLFLEGSNGARELVQQFSNPGSEHWIEVKKYEGYLKKHQKEIKMMYHKPKELERQQQLHNQ
jgi:hypothetical protein